MIVFGVVSGLIVFSCVMQGWYLAKKNNELLRKEKVQDDTQNLLDIFDTAIYASILLDSIILLISLCRISSKLRYIPSMKASKGTIFMHFILMVLLILASVQ